MKTEGSDELTMNKRMRKLKILGRIMKETRADRILSGFVIFYVGCAVIIWLWEPGIKSLGDALWYCYAVITTIGFGDIIVTTHIARIISVVLSIYAVLVIAIVTGVIVNYFTQIVQLRQKDTLVSVLDKLEHLPEMSERELEELSKQIHDMRQKH